MPNLDDWRPVRRNTRNYLADLEAWVSEFVPVTPLLLPAPSPESVAMWQAAQEVAQRMVERVARTNAQSWRAAIARHTQAWQSRRIFAALKNEMQSTVVGQRVRELITSNQRLILALPDTLSRQTAIFVARQQQRGLRSSAITAELEHRLPLLRQSAVRMLARTEVARTETALTRTRSERLGLRWYEWATSEDSRVRPSHRLMDKMLVAWDDPAAPERLAGVASGSRLGHYHPGGAFNCRCLALPLVDLNEVGWPHRIYAHGTVVRMGRNEFEWISGLETA